MTTRDLTAQRLRELLDYDPLTGNFTWAIGRPGARKGDRAGCTDKKYGYICIKVDRVLHRAHRLAYLWMIGQWPDATIDHKDRKRHNNSWVNIRPATRKQNQENLPLDPRNTSGHRGVHWCKKDRLWIASIGHHGKKYVLGRSPAIDAAIRMRLDGERLYFTHSHACELQA